MKSITAKRARRGPSAGGSCPGRWVTGRTWCVAPRKPLFLRRRAPRLLGPRRRWRTGRGAPLPANPYSFVAGHHVFRVQGANGGADVVRRSPQSLIPSSPSTTSSGSKAPVLGRTWCVAPRKPLFLRRRAPRKPLFLRRRAPRLPGQRRRRRAGRHPDMKQPASVRRDGEPVQVVLFIITIPTQRHRCTAGSRCPSGR